jgi:hypothetical protein
MSRLVGWASGLVLAAGLAAIAVQPTGSAGVAGSVPTQDRLITTVAVGPARVLLLADLTGALGVQVDYPSPKGWLAVRPPVVPLATTIAWTSTPGAGPLPALSAAFGQATGARVRLAWSDGVTQTVPVTADGSWLSARSVVAALSQVWVVDARGRVLLTVGGS